VTSDADPPVAGLAIRNGGEHPCTDAEPSAAVLRPILAAGLTEAAGFVGVIGHGGDHSIEAEAQALSKDYETLRGAGHRVFLRAGEWASTVGFRNRPFDVELPTDGRGWALAAGAVHISAYPTGSGAGGIEGQFALITYDEALKTVVVVSDPFGMHGLYLARRDGRLYFSTSVLALARHLRAKPSLLGLRIYLRAGYHFGSTTNWEGIERIDPAVLLTLTPERMERHVYWRPTVDRDVARLRFVSAVDHCIEVATDACRSLFAQTPPAWADLSGGYDTRLLALLLDRAGVAFETNTRGRPHVPDIPIAREVARKAGWKWLPLMLPEEWDALLPSFLPVALAWGDGNLDAVELSRVLWAHEELARKRTGLISGGGGEHYRGFAWRQEFFRAGRSSRVNMDNWLDMRLLHPLNTTILASDPTAEVRADFADRMQRRAEPYSDERNTTQLDVMYAYKMTGHFGAFLSADGAYLTSCLPFYFRTIFEAAFSTSHHHRGHHRLMRHMIQRLSPSLAAVETSTGGPAQPWRARNLHRFGPYYVDVARRAVAKLSHRAVGRAFLAPRRAPNPSATRARGVLVSELRANGILGPPEMRSAPLYNRRAFVEWLEHADQPAFQDEALIGRVITVELALRAVDAAVEG
jgi:hypothetical protein